MQLHMEMELCNSCIDPILPTSIRADKIRNNQISIVATPLIEILSNLSHCSYTIPFRPRNRDDSQLVLAFSIYARKEQSIHSAVSNAYAFDYPVNSIDNILTTSIAFLSFASSFHHSHNACRSNSMVFFCVETNVLT